MQTIDILWKDEHLLVVNKPPGLLTVPGRGPDKQDCLINRLLVPYPNSRIVHRLDQPTSGIVIVPQSYTALKHIGRQFETRQVSKEYIAVVAGLVDADSGQVNLPLICDWPNRPRQMVDHENGKNALTHYRVLERREGDSTTRISLTPVTGRSHQLRVHMLSLGHPIVGDHLYAPPEIAQREPRLLLHARHIEFRHPLSEEILTITCEPNF
ncbi:RluA family pseudouridine synthase [Gilvimarinus xylanilyticus]|uniref:RluA family pseudouridine synthase n=1 Tax=Gilvimarinus xylanilyticus TaxID=2944139 RepID=A0A9X2I1Z6_9GAMM|nr:RluA family pseudouridine synthase [Gilvimarinus xylanilyticus]MCP8898057.1 RluA family pseudouridine synthase [Gilvimarinus xylanilyticus]